MNQTTLQILFALLRSAVCGTLLTDEERATFSQEQLSDLFKMSQKHDIAHLLVLGLKKNDLIPKTAVDIEKVMLKALYRYERLNYEYIQVCSALESVKIPFIPLKGSILRDYYPEAWMRTSCDVDLLVHKEDLENAISYLTENLNYVIKERGTHDVALSSPIGNSVELHFDLVEEGRANNAISILSSVWDNVSLYKDCNYRYEMSDAFFYFYHIAHMAKHIENGGCGIRPFIDLWILDNIEGINQNERDVLLSDGGLLKFADVARKLSKVWFGCETADEVSLQLQKFLLIGGVYGTADNRVAIQQNKKGGRLGYILSRVFIPFSKLKRYYPVLEKHPWLMPFMQIRRWFMLLRPDVAKLAKKEIASNKSIEKSKADQMNCFLDNLGL